MEFALFAETFHLNLINAVIPFINNCVTSFTTGESIMTLNRQTEQPQNELEKADITVYV